MIETRAPLALQRILNTTRKPIPTFWWRYDYPNRLNFGDELTPYIVKKLWNLDCEWADIPNCEFAATGSIIEVLDWKSSDNHIKVWGSGFIKDGPRYDSKNLDFFAVRGPLTKKRIYRTKREIACGDPGLLANKVFKKSRKIKYDVGIISHYDDADDPRLDKFRHKDNVIMISPLDSPQNVISKITSCRLILSSSLHGLIISDSFSIPNFWMPLSELQGKDYKFRDYYQSTGRELIKIDTNIDATNYNDLSKTYVPIANLSRIQAQLINAFPYQRLLRIQRFFSYFRH